jgi:hypothetical protein
MAEAIANKSPMIEVPGALRSLFTRAIKARQKAAEWFTASHSDTILDESNQTRAHFVDILQRAGHVLEPLVKERPTQAPKPKQPPEKSKLASMQQVLEPCRRERDHARRPRGRKRRSRPTGRAFGITPACSVCRNPARRIGDRPRILLRYPILHHDIWW